MQSSPQAVSTSAQTQSNNSAPAHSRADLMYQLVTVAAVLLLLGSLWVF